MEKILAGVTCISNLSK